MRFQIIDVKKSSPIWKTRFEEYRRTIIKNDKISRNIDNYKPSNFQLEFLLGLYLVFDKKNNRIAGFFSVFTPKIWPKYIARINNRTYVDLNYRKGLSVCGNKRELRHNSGWGSTIGYKHQLKCCLENKVKLAVITRENVRGPNSKNNFDLIMYKQFGNKYHGWNMGRGYYLTCSNGDDFRCWQKLVFINLEKHENPELLLAPIPRISLSEYNRKFNNKTKK